MNESCRTLLYTHNGYGCEDVAEKGFVSLMDLYENNFIRFRKLVNALGVSEYGETQLGDIGSSAVSKVGGYQDLHMEVLEHGRFTSTVCLTYRFIEDDRYSAEPNLVFRIYHDAKLVEVLSGHLKHGRQHHDHLPRESAKMKWRLNRLLYKWLGFCLHVGHGFSRPAEK
jgi:uncharacterized protein YqiB (DUF1249 family)